MSEIKINSIDLNHNDTVQVHLTVDNDLLLNIKIARPAGNQNDWTLGEIKKLAIEEAKSRIPS